LQTRRPPILPAFSAILKDGSDFASIEKNVSLFKGFGSSNKESIAELFVSMMIKVSCSPVIYVCRISIFNFWTYRSSFDDFLSMFLGIISALLLDMSV